MDMKGLIRIKQQRKGSNPFFYRVLHVVHECNACEFLSEAFLAAQCCCEAILFCWILWRRAPVAAAGLDAERISGN